MPYILYARNPLPTVLRVSVQVGGVFCKECVCKSVVIFEKTHNEGSENSKTTRCDALWRLGFVCVLCNCARRVILIQTRVEFS